MIKKASRLNTLNSNKYRNANAGNTAIVDVPDAPTGVVATDVGTSRAFNNGAVSASFTPALTGGAPVSFTVTSTPGSFTGTGSSSPVSVAGLASNVSYTFAVTATNTTGTSPSSVSSSAVVATTVPGAPTIGSASGGVGGAVSVSFTAPSNSGGKTITSYTALSSSGVSSSGSSSPISVNEVSSGTFTYTVTATNPNGTSVASAASNSLAVTASITDNFNRTTSGSLGISSSGATWTAISGTWYANGSQAQDTADIASSYPIAAVSLSASSTVSASVFDGTGVAFWVSSSSAWYAAFPYNVSTPYSCGCGTCCNTCSHTGGSCGTTTTCNTCTVTSSSLCGSTLTCTNGAYPYLCGGNCNELSSCNGASIQATSTANTCTVTNCTACGSTTTNNTCTNSDCTACGSYSCGCSTCYSNYYYLRSLKSVSGTVSTLFSDVALSTAAVSVKVITNSSTGFVTLYAYSDTSMTTQVGTTSGTPSSPIMGTNVGIIMAPAGTTQNTVVDNFSAHN